MKSSDILRAFSDADAGYVEQAAEQHGKAYQPDISAALDAVRSGETTLPFTRSDREGRTNRVMLWACGIAACAAVVFTGVMLSQRGEQNMTQPTGGEGSSVPMVVVTETTAQTGTAAPVADTVSREIPFRVVSADYHPYDGSMTIDQQEAVQSCVIRSAEDLKANPVQPEKQYSDDFYRDHALIFVSTVFTCTGDLPEVTAVRCNGNRIEVTAVREPAMDEALQWWCTFIEVDAAEIPADSAEIVLHSDTQIPKQTQAVQPVGDIPFTAAAADYHITDSQITYNDLKNMVIYDAESLSRCYVHPVQTYDAAFFKEHALIFVTNVFSTTNQHEVAVNHVRRTENGLSVSITREQDEVEASALQWWCTFLEVDRSALANSADTVMLDIAYQLSCPPQSTAPHTDYTDLTMLTTTARATDTAQSGTTQTSETEYTTTPPTTNLTEPTVGNPAFTGEPQRTSATEPTAVLAPSPRDNFDDAMPFAFLIRVGEEYDDELHIETGEEWYKWYSAEKQHFYCAAKGELQERGLHYAEQEYTAYDMLWFKVNITGDLPEIRRISYTGKGLLNIEAAMIPGELDADVYRICVPIPRSGNSITKEKVKIWKLETFRDTMESGVLPQLGEQLTAEKLHELVKKGSGFTWEDLIPYNYVSHEFFRSAEGDVEYYAYPLENRWFVSFRRSVNGSSKPIEVGSLTHDNKSYQLNDSNIPWNEMEG